MPEFSENLAMEEQGDVTILSFRCTNISFHAAKDFEDAYAQIRSPKILVDFKGVRLATSRSTTTLLNMVFEVEDEGKHVYFCNLPPIIQRYIDAAKIEEYTRNFKIVKTRDEALESLECV